VKHLATSVLQSTSAQAASLASNYSMSAVLSVVLEGFIVTVSVTNVILIVQLVQATICVQVAPQILYFL
jgi:hypothetical protein